MEKEVLVYSRTAERDVDEGLTFTFIRMGTKAQPDFRSTGNLQLSGLLGEAARRPLNKYE